jgi:Flp pilus assembly pilin Flp
MTRRLLSWKRGGLGKIVRDPHSLFVVLGSDDERGASTIEYALTVVAVAAAAVLGVSAFGRWVVPLFERAANIFK